MIHFDSFLLLLPSTLAITSSFHQTLRRSLQVDATATNFPIAPCDRIVDTLTKIEIEGLLGQIIDGFSEGFENVVLRGAFVNNIRHGVQVRRVCASCQENQPEEDDYDFCQAYGNDISYSGLIFLPTDAEDTSSIVIGTLCSMQSFWGLDLQPMAGKDELRYNSCAVDFA